jgi:hypothetical protein
MLVAMLLASSLATIGAGAMSLAVFTDSKASTGAWTTGSVTLGVSPTAAFNVTNAMPGDFGAQIIGVSNTGLSQLRYALTSSSTNTDSKGLAAQVTLLVTNGTVQSNACTGTTLYSGPLSLAAFGSTAPGGQAGDRTVDPGATDNLCFGWSFPAASGDAFQNATTTSTFTFSAEQTANNP